MNMGFVKVASLSPIVEIANPKKNVETAIAEIEKASKAGAQIIALPELYLSGCTCGDLVYQQILLNQCKDSLISLAEYSAKISALIIVGLPLAVNNRLYNVAAVLQRGKIVGVVPKTYLATYNESDEKRWYVTPNDIVSDDIVIDNEIVPFGKLMFKMNDEVIVGVEISEDLKVPVSPSSLMSLQGANVIVNIAASNDIVGRDENTKSLIKQQSIKNNCAYVYTNIGYGESTTDVVYFGRCIIAENGKVVAENKRFSYDSSSAIACINIEKLNADRLKKDSFVDNAKECLNEVNSFDVIECSISKLEEENIDIKLNQHPFIPVNDSERNDRCEEILAIQTAGLVKRMKHIGLQKAVLGVSGGLDSTLALLVIQNAMKIMNLPMENIICITMPGFGTTDRTYYNALELIDSIGAQKREIDIKPSSIQHMNDIGHDVNVHDVTFENTQARERTQILMDIANKEGAIHVGTGDLSELAMGWCTFNGDHMSMYCVNGDVPKTLIQYIVKYVAENTDKKTGDVLIRILETPISPELLPPDKEGKIKQKTEDKIGPYELHDFYLYHFMRYGATPKKIKFLAQKAFGTKYSSEEIDKWLTLFLKRFFQSQFKRSCMPDGPKVGSIGLSPRGDFKMPSDSNCQIWLDDSLK